MSTTTSLQQLDAALDICGEMSGMFGLYTQISMFYALPHDFKLDVVAHVTATINAGLARLAAEFPYTAGQVIQLEALDSARRRYRMRPLHQAAQMDVKDLRQVADQAGSSANITLAQLRAAEYPLSMLGEEWLAPCATISPELPRKPILLLRVCVLQDGVVVTVNGEHQAMDMVGQGAVMASLNKACRREAFDRNETSIGNTDRTHSIPLLGEGINVGSRIQRQMVAEQTALSEPESTAHAPQPTCQWAYFDVSAASMKALKSRASLDIESGFVSTDDCLSALLWQSVLRARSVRLPDGQKSTLGRAVDARRYVGVDKSYPGFVQNMVYAGIAVKDLVQAPVGHIAALLRSKIDPAASSVGLATQELLTALYRADADGRSKLGFVVGLALDVDLMVSSWAAVNCYALDFGLGFGQPEKVRRPRLVDCESLAYFMPHDKEGNGAVAICLRTEDMSELRRDNTWCTYARYIG
ncbi:hypothetical protein ANO11243_084970 [Dothideomycetidae sp. 11243]|nr:hypothetical protein ANO11243_084970 [fungal sp. No.11243]